MNVSGEPRFSASVFAAGHLDMAIRGIVLPWWQAVREPFGELGGLWMVRYGRGGEHLKIRAHGPDDVAIEDMANRLEAMAEECFGTWPAADEEQRANARSPAIDEEDETDALYPDRSVLITHPRRNHVVFAGGPWLDDAEHAMRSTTVLMRATDAMFDVIEAQDEAASWPHSVRQNTLFRWLAAGLSGLGMAAEERAIYHRFHRDWLLRTVGRAFEVGGDERLAKLTDHMELLTQGKMARAVEALTTKLLPACDLGPSSPVDERWRSALLDMVDHGRRLAAGDQAFVDVDPYADEPVFLPVFKAFHNLANQLGLAMRDEALAHQLLLSANLRGA